MSPGSARLMRLPSGASPICARTITYLGDTIDALRADGIEVTDEIAAHLTPAQHDHINFYGTYSFDIDAELRRDGHRPLRVRA
jgi:Tn3 transposase DDE domain